MWWLSGADSLQTASHLIAACLRCFGIPVQLSLSTAQILVGFGSFTMLQQKGRVPQFGERDL